MGDLKLQMPERRELNGGDLLAQSLHHLGVDVAFGLHGGHLDAFLLGAEEAGIKLVDTRHETTAVQAAEGYAKISGKVGVCFVTANSGFANGLPGLMSAFADRSPVLCITSSPPLQDAETNALQGFHDQVVVAKPMTKFAHRITNAEEIPRIAAYAYRAANSGIKGPVLLDFPIDVLFTPPQIHRIAYGAVAVPPAYPPAPHPAALAQLAKSWSAAKRPVIITGTGSRGSGELLTNSPIGYDHELRGGPATALAAFAGKAQPDFILLLAARTGFLLAGRSGAIIPKQDCVLAQVDVDGTEIGKSHPIEIGIVSDASVFLETFLSSAKDVSFERQEEWIKTCGKLRSGPSQYENDPKVQPDGQLHPYLAMEAVMRSIPPDSIIVVDGGEAGQFACMAAEQAKPHVVIVSSGYLGMLGNGWGYSLGAAVADPSRLVVNIHGDGSAGFHIQELDTFARFGLRIMTLVANNYVWGMSVNGQSLLYDQVTTKRPATQLSKACRYDTVAEGFACAGEYVTKFDQIQPAVEKVAERAPSLINMIVSAQPTTPATSSMVGATKDPNVIVVPYYDNVPRAYYKDSASGKTSGPVNGG